MFRIAHCESGQDLAGTQGTANVLSIVCPISQHAAVGARNCRKRDMSPACMPAGADFRTPNLIMIPKGASMEGVARKLIGGSSRPRSAKAKKIAIVCAYSRNYYGHLRINRVALGFIN